MSDKNDMADAEKKAAELVAISNRAARLVGPVNVNLQRQLDVFPSLRKFTENVQRAQELSRAALGPSESLKALIEQASNPPWIKQLLQTQKAFEDRFRLPQLCEMTRLLQAVEPASEMARYQTALSTRIQQAMASMRSPWLDSSRELESIRGFAGLQGMGHALQSLTPFGEEIASLLRTELGDWRDGLTFPEPVFDDFAERTGFYIDRGFDARLTDFPGEAFDEGVELAELRVAPPPIVVAYGAPVPVARGGNDEAGFVRTNTAHDWLQRFESHLRQFIDQVMTQAHGEDWPRHRLPNGLYEKWQDKKRKAEQAGGQAYRIVAYADFVDYVDVICKRDNWVLFKPVFGREELVRESFQRLYPIRVCTMHARIITTDDELYLWVEIRRLMTAIRTAGEKS